MSRKVDLIGVPLDLGTGRRGVDMGPSAVRVTGLRQRLEDLGHDVEDRGDVRVPIPETCEPGGDTQRFVQEIAAVCWDLARWTEKAIGAGRTPVALGGDHSLAAGSVAGVSRALKARGETLGLIWVDAHADMNTPETTPSGNVHGMPLAACLGRGPEALVAVGGGASVRASDVVLLGLRNLDERERLLVRDSGVHAYTMADVDRRGMATLMTEILQRLNATTAGVHLSVDLDGLDPEVAPGVGTAVMGGLSYREAHLLCEMVAESRRLLAMDVVELNPTLDVRNRSAEVAAELILSALGQRIL